MENVPSQLLEHTARPDLDERYPGYGFMELLRTDTQEKSLVGTRQSITGEPFYQELPFEEGIPVEALAAEIVDWLDTLYEEDRLMRSIVAYHTPEEWKQLKEAEKEEERLK